ncbi:MAG: hypothetical protein GYA23_11395, partial [Methanomicrobiales archaeon]|nr:hypothetical protein [Methanomicrobiales archaeon]
MKNEDAISELVDETLLLALVVVCAGIAGILLISFAVPVEKTAYLVPQFGLKDVDSKTVISVYNQGGEPLVFNSTGPAKYR